MADDNGLIADIEAQIAAKLAAITLSGDTVFRTADIWRGQLISPDSFRRYAPFAFVEYAGTAKTDVPSGAALTQVMRFSVRVGTQVSKKAEGARVGIGTDAANRELGVSRLRDLVITALQYQRPTTTDSLTEYFEFISDEVVWDQPLHNSFAILMSFQIDRTTEYTPG